MRAKAYSTHESFNSEIDKVLLNILEIDLSHKSNQYFIEPGRVLPAAEVGNIGLCGAGEFTASSPRLLSLATEAAEARRAAERSSGARGAISRPARGPGKVPSRFANRPSSAAVASRGEHRSASIWPSPAAGCWSCRSRSGRQCRQAPRALDDGSPGLRSGPTPRRLGPQAGRASEQGPAATSLAAVRPFLGWLFRRACA